MVTTLKAADSKGVFQYQTPSGGWLPSTLYTWDDMIAGVKIMAEQGIGNMSLYVGEGANYKYGLVNLAAFLGESMKGDQRVISTLPCPSACGAPPVIVTACGPRAAETIMYNACDENNWSNPDVTKMFGGTACSRRGSLTHDPPTCDDLTLCAPLRTDTASYACGQGKQSYQDYKCTADDDAIAGGKMACDVDPEMEMRAHTQAEWYGAPPALFCAPKSKVPKAPKWNWKGPVRPTT